MARPRLPINETTVLESYAAGETVPGIALRLNVDRSRVDRVLDDHDVVRRGDRGRHWSDARPPAGNHPAKPVALVGPTPDWMETAACTRPGINPDIFFPDSGAAVAARTAALVCETCPVAKQCTAYAMDHNERVGVWGGLTANQRASLRRRPSTGQPKTDGPRLCPRCENEVPKAPKGGRLTYCSDPCRQAARAATLKRNDARKARRAS